MELSIPLLSVKKTDVFPFTRLPIELRETVYYHLLISEPLDVKFRLGTKHEVRHKTISRELVATLLAEPPWSSNGGEDLIVELANHDAHRTSTWSSVAKFEQIEEEYAREMVEVFLHYYRYKPGMSNFGS
ncbi:hypothetical protein BDV96DRAFT_643453 [Lophiotrema nucula]|uniref:Uncharacterized protein n=1 Tax=Lophiotrema nucula TaxID=690887 RepID=A0A6A5ZH18_9PLEO|nr:hypothetical protein BDV96DRAFT_643453 [Lophiotrema nucula]